MVLFQCLGLGCPARGLASSLELPEVSVVQHHLSLVLLLILVRSRPFKCVHSVEVRPVRAVQPGEDALVVGVEWVDPLVAVLVGVAGEVDVGQLVLEFVVRAAAS